MFPFWQLLSRGGGSSLSRDQATAPFAFASQLSRLITGTRISFFFFLLVLPSIGAIDAPWACISSLGSLCLWPAALFAPFRPLGLSSIPTDKPSPPPSSQIQVDSSGCC